MLTKIKDFLDKYNVSLTMVGTAIVLSTLFGECSVDYLSGEVEVTTDVTEIVEEIKKEDD